MITPRGRSCYPYLLCLTIYAAMIPKSLNAQSETSQIPASQYNSRAPRFLLKSARGYDPIDAARTPILRRRISLNVERMKLRDALSAISRKAGIDLMYSDEIVNTSEPVSLRANGITVAAALTDVLLDAGVDVIFTNLGSAVLVKRDASGEVALATGRITGRVSDSGTKLPLRNATVSIDGTRFSSLTSEDGTYSLNNIPEGTYTISARHLGYLRASQSIQVSTSIEAHADFLLVAGAKILDQVVVTGTLVPTEQRALPTPITVVTSDDITAKAVTNIAELFRGEIPGVMASLQGGRTQDASGMNLIVRGMSLLDPGGKPNSIKTYVDGIEIAEPRFVADIDPSIIERIEILRGPEASTLYGAGAMNGVMQIFTKRGNTGDQHPHLTGTLAAGGLNAPSADGLKPQSLASLFVRGGGPAFSYSFGGTQEYTGPWIPEYHRYDRSLQGGVHLTQGKFSVDGSARLGLLQYNTPFLARTRDRILEGQYRYTTTALPQRSRTDRQQQTIGATMTYAFLPSLQSALTIGQDGLNEELINRAKFASPADTNNFIRVTNQRRTSISFNTSGNKDIGPTHTTLTVGAEKWWYGDAISSASATSTVVGSLTGAATVSRSRYDNTGYFAQTLVGIRDMLFLTAGIRAEDSPNFGEEHGLDYSPRFGASYVQDIGDATVKLRAAYGRSIKPPSPSQKTGSVSATSTVLPNQDIGPERQRGFDTGVDLFVGRSSSIQATYYNHVVDGLVTLTYVSVPGVTPSIFQFRNVGRVRNTGWELQGETRLFSPFTLQATYSIFNSRILRLDPNYAITTLFPAYKEGDRLVAVPRNTGALSATYALNGFMAKVTAYRTGRVAGYNNGPTSDASSDRLFPRTPVFPDEYVAPFDPFVRYDVNASQRLTNRLSGFVRVENIFNNLSSDFSNSNDMYGRTMWIGIHLN